MFDRHESKSIDTNLISLPEWITMELAKANKNSTPMGGYASYWGSRRD
jgi:hypothetical protein